MARLAFLMEMFLATLLFSQAVFCLQCYICNSANDEDCNGSAPAEKYRQDCPSFSPHFERYPQLEKTLGLGRGSKHNKNNSLPNQALPNQGASELGSTTVVNRTERSVAENKDEVDLELVSSKIPREATFCRKIVNHIPTQNNGPDSLLPAHIRVVRSCGYVSEKKEGKVNSTCKWIGTDGIHKEFCECYGDGCNAGNYMDSLKVHTMILLSVMTIGYVYVL